MKNYYQGCNTKLLAKIPKCKKVLELGCAAGLLGWHYKQEFPDAEWHGVDISAEALEVASTRLDNTYLIHLDRQSIKNAGDEYDCIVLGDILVHLIDPLEVLADLHSITTPDAKIFCCVPNMGHASVMERMIAGDLTYDDEGLLDKTHLRFFTKGSLIKLFLDAGWYPNIADSYKVPSQNEEFMRHITAAAGALGLPSETALENFTTYQYIIDCTKIKKACSAPALELSIVVPVNNEQQVALNVLKSPGLMNLNVGVTLCRGAKNASEAFEMGKENSTNEWILFCHQDVYFPPGFGENLSNAINQLDPGKIKKTVIGFAGLALDVAGNIVQSGSVVDRGIRFEHPPSEKIISLDEFAIVMHKSCELKIDPALGWHLWATDLCLQGIHNLDDGCYPISIQESIFHNSYNNYVLSDDFRRSADILLEKYPHLTVIPTLCGNILR
jgi:2-polyprenyl-3-methyl-5-hydroxy-6-metoxy-1,4-benzoquinol methylase